MIPSQCLLEETADPFDGGAWPNTRQSKDTIPHRLRESSPFSHPHHFCTLHTTTANNAFQESVLLRSRPYHWQPQRRPPLLHAYLMPLYISPLLRRFGVELVLLRRDLFEVASAGQMIYGSFLSSHRKFWSKEQLCYALRPIFARTAVVLWCPSTAARCHPPLF